MGEAGECGLDQCGKGVTVVYIGDVEIVFGSVVWRPKDDFLQKGPAGLRYLDIQVIVADQAEQDTIAVNALVSHHLFRGNISGAGALVYDVLNEV